MKRILSILLAIYSCIAIADSNPYAAESAIYKIVIPHPNGQQVSQGSGALIARDKILTNCHIVNKPGWPHVIHRQTGQQFNVTKHYNLGKHDACVLVGTFAGNPVQLTDNINKDENVWIFGYPKGLSVVSQGSVKEFVYDESGKSLLLTAFCAPGSSGGPVINSRGQLVGLNYATYQYQNQCLSIPAASLLPYL